MRSYGNVLNGLDFLDGNFGEDEYPDTELKEKEKALLQMIQDSEKESNEFEKDLPSTNNSGGIWVDGDNTSGVTWRTFPDGSRKLILSEERAAEIQQMCVGIANKYVNKSRRRGTAGADWDSWNGVSRDDLVQEAWTKVIESLSLNPKLPNKLLSTCIRNRILDIGRYQNRRKNQVPISPDTFATSDINSDKTHMEQCEWNKNAPLGTNFLDEMLIEDIENLFEKGSPQWEYVRLCEEYDGVEFHGKWVHEIFDMKDTRKNAIAKAMGFDHGYVPAFRNIESCVRGTVRRYLKEVRNA